MSSRKGALLMAVQLEDRNKRNKRPVSAWSRSSRNDRYGRKSDIKVLGKQIGRGDFQSLCQLLHDRDCWISRSALDVAHVSSMNACAVSVIFLAPAVRGPKAFDVRAQAFANIHARQETPPSTIDLQTMSDN